jgi:splicing factor U2AF subunit
MGRSRSRSAERKKSRRDKSPPAATTAPVRSSGKWDEGFGGVYLPTSAQVENVSSNLAATLPTVGPLAERKLIVNGIPKAKSAKDVVDEFAQSILSATGHASTVDVYPVVSCQFLTAVGATRNAMVEFRTPKAASAALTTMAETYKMKRPKDFPSSLSAGGLSEEEMKNLSPSDIGATTAENIGDSSATSTALVASDGNGTAAVGWNRLSVYGLPGNLFTDQIVKDLFGQFGKIRTVSFVKDPITSLVKPATTGFVEYEDAADSLIAEQALNGFPCGNSVVKVQRVEPVKASTGSAGNVVAPRRAPLAASIASSVTARVLGNAALAAQIKQGKEIGARPSLVVQLLNAVYAEDIADDGDYNDIVKEVKEEASKFGHVESIKIPRSGAGVGKIFVQFADLTTSRKFQQDMNGRSFDNRVVCAAFYPVDRYVQGKYVLYHD